MLLALYGLLAILSFTLSSVTSMNHNPGMDDTILVKIGGSSVTHKGDFESLNADALTWFAQSIWNASSSVFHSPIKECEATRESSNMEDRRPGFVIVHGAGSFGHFTAKEYGLKGHSLEPPPSGTGVSTDALDRRRDRLGLAKTRLSVQKLNRMVVEQLVEHGVNAVGISPCFGVPGLETHANAQSDAQDLLQATVRRTLEAGLVPVLHGDACLYGASGVGILSGDVLMEVLGVQPWISKAVFITDVDGVFDQDPRQNPEATLLRNIGVNATTGEIVAEVAASGSSHEHDVTGGLKVRNILWVFHKLQSLTMSSLMNTDQNEIRGHHCGDGKECDGCQMSVHKRRASTPQRIHRHGVNIISTSSSRPRIDYF
jgi:isopentenyl phosphate kinase